MDFLGSGTRAFRKFVLTQGVNEHILMASQPIRSLRFTSRRLCEPKRDVSHMRGGQDNVAHAPRYLTAFRNTQSEIIVPIIDPESQQVIGTLAVESERKGAFTEADREQLEGYARALADRWR